MPTSTSFHCLILPLCYWGGARNSTSHLTLLIPQGESSFLLSCLAEVRQVTSKYFCSTRSHFPSSLARRTFFSSVISCMPVASCRLEVSVVCCQGYMEGSKESQGTHHHVIPPSPKVPRQFSIFSLLLGVFLCCFLHYVQGSLVVTERTWEEWDYSIFAGPRSPYILSK